MAGPTGTNGTAGARPRPPGPNDVQPASGKGGPPPKKNPLMQPRPWWISFLVVLVLNYLLVQVFLPERPNPRIDVPYTYFKQQVMADNVIDVTSQGDTIQGTFRNAVTYPTDPSQGQQQTSTLFATVQPQFADTGLEALLEQHNVVINAHSLDQPRSWWQTLLLSFGPNSPINSRVGPKLRRGVRGRYCS